MSYCQNCGNEVSGKFCSNCGQPVENSIQKPEQTTVADANQLSNEEKMKILRERMDHLEKNPSVDRKTKIGAIIRLVVMGLIFALCAWAAISDGVTKDASVMRTLGSIFAGVIIADLAWIIIKLCTFVSLPLAKALWEEFVGLGLVGFFIKIGLCLGVLLLPVVVVGALLRYLADYMQAHENIVTTILIIAVPLAFTALIVWFEIRKIKR